jgi:hypothetical protein
VNPGGAYCRRKERKLKRIKNNNVSCFGNIGKSTGKNATPDPDPVGASLLAMDVKE